MKCGWDCGAQLSGRNMRAHFTICAKRPAASGDVERRGGAQARTPAGQRMLCVWRDGTRLTASRSRAHLTEGRG